MAITMARTAAPPARREPSAPLAERVAAVLTAGCDGYPAGTTGEVLGHRQGCVEFAPDAHARVARWARPRTRMLVPLSFVLTLR